MKIDNTISEVMGRGNVVGKQTTNIPPKALKDIMERTSTAVTNQTGIASGADAYSYSF